MDVQDVNVFFNTFFPRWRSGFDGDNGSVVGNRKRRIPFAPPLMEAKLW